MNAHRSQAKKTRLSHACGLARRAALTWAAVDSIRQENWRNESSGADVTPEETALVSEWQREIRAADRAFEIAARGTNLDRWQP